MAQIPPEPRKLDRELHVGDYLKVAADRYAPGRRRPGEAFARIERVEHVANTALTAESDLHAHPPVTAPRREPRPHLRAVVLCHGMPGPVILRGGSHRVLAEVGPDRAANDELHPWWAHLGPQSLFRHAVLPGGLPPRPRHRAGAAPSGRDSATAAQQPAPRRAASFTKPPDTVRVGDYVRVLAARYPEYDRDIDEGFARVEWIGYLAPEHSARMLSHPGWAGSVVTAVVVHGLSGLLLLPDHEIEVMVWPNPERAAIDRQQPWLGTPPVTIAGLREPTGAENAQAQMIDERLRPAPPAGEEALYPVTITDEHERALIFHGVDGIRAVPLAALPWPHNLGKCDHVQRIEAITRTYPADDDAESDAAEQAITAEAFTQFTLGDFAACRYHQADWARIGAIALELTELGADALDAIDRDKRLSPADRDGLASLFLDPICWEDGSDSLTDGQHRLCALRAAGVPACPVQGWHLPQQDYAPPRDAAEHAKHTVTQYWRTYLTNRLPSILPTQAAAWLLAHSRHLRRLLPYAKRDEY